MLNPALAFYSVLTIINTDDSLYKEKYLYAMFKCVFILCLGGLGEGGVEHLRRHEWKEPTGV